MLKEEFKKAGSLQGHFEIEITNTSKKFLSKEIWGDKITEKQIKIYKEFLFLDYLFPIAYGLFAMCVVAVLTNLNNKKNYFFTVTFWLMPIASILDFIENSIHWLLSNQILTQITNGVLRANIKLNDNVILTSFSISITKLSLAGLCIIFTFIILIEKIIKKISKK